MRIFIKIIVGIIILVVLTIGGAGFYITRGLDAGNDLSINHVDTSQIKDGVYKGEYSGGRWSNEVDVTIETGKVAKINIIKTVLFEKPEVTSALLKNVIEKQGVDIDVISGSTVTSKAYLKAIENALSK